MIRRRPASSRVVRHGPVRSWLTQNFGSPEETPGPSPVRKGAAEDLFRLLRKESGSLGRLGDADCNLAALLRKKLDAVSAADLGVDPSDVTQMRADVCYQEVYSGPSMTMCVFLLRAGGVIPLHDHPGMHVFGRLLFGRMRSISLDVEEQNDEVHPPPGPPGACWARIHSDVTLGPKPTTYGLGPEEGNLHTLHALEDSAFFDVLTPPYDWQAGRDCTYFGRVGADPEDASRLSIIPRSRPPRDFVMDFKDYKGPKYVA